MKPSFFQEAFQDKAVAVTEAFAVAKKTQKEVKNQLSNICIGFFDILSSDLTITPTGPKKKKNCLDVHRKLLKTNPRRRACPCSTPAHRKQAEMECWRR